MLTVIKRENTYDGIKKHQLKYTGVDFYGPFLFMELEIFPNGEITITPKKVKQENVEFSVNHLDIILDASEEILQKYGKFTLKIPKWNWYIEVKDHEQIKKELGKRIRSIRLF